ncbi:hypothetical protein KP509_20G046100 [Ceratopteris richardii]|uniref:Uncharacterized protein n=1 Tax=Ceratopteris richardii TaxID=49495 RepID=A0A8T2SIU4_CERRI|nr:hypothetical protein KP509_20G046100 [Ceratopteris richardii]
MAQETYSTADIDTRTLIKDCNVLNFIKDCFQPSNPNSIDWDKVCFMLNCTYYEVFHTTFLSGRFNCSSVVLDVSCCKCGMRAFLSPGLWVNYNLVMLIDKDFPSSSPSQAPFSYNAYFCSLLKSSDILQVKGVFIGVKDQISRIRWCTKSLVSVSYLL